MYRKYDCDPAPWDVNAATDIWYLCADFRPLSISM